MNPFNAIFKAFAPAGGAIPYSFRQDGLLHFLEARRGRGKSYVLNEVIYWCIRKKVPVWTNSLSTDYYKLGLMACVAGCYDSLEQAMTWIQDNIHFMRNWDDVLTAYGGVMVWDEITRSFEGRQGFNATKPPFVMYDYWKQSRKFFMTCYLAGHDLNDLDRKVAGLIDLMWVTRKVPVKGKFAPDGTAYPKEFWLYATDPGGAGKTDAVKRNQASMIMRLPFNLKVAQAYNSWEIIRFIDGECSFPKIQDVEQYHIDQGRLVAPDPDKMIAFHVSRLRDRSDPFDTWVKSLVEVPTSVTA